MSWYCDLRSVTVILPILVNVISQEGLERNFSQMSTCMDELIIDIGGKM